MKHPSLCMTMGLLAIISLRTNGVPIGTADFDLLLDSAARAIGKSTDAGALDSSGSVKSGLLITAFDVPDYKDVNSNEHNSILGLIRPDYSISYAFSNLNPQLIPTRGVYKDFNNIVSIQLSRPLAESESEVMEIARPSQLDFEAGAGPDVVCDMLVQLFDSADTASLKPNDDNSVFENWAE